jgi:hypothetical protein
MTDSNIITRQQLIDWTIHCLPDPYRVPSVQGASYNYSIRQLEYVSRPLWAVFSMLAGKCCPEDILQKYIRRIKDGITPDSPLKFPVPTTETRQTAVEMAVYGYGLLACGNDFLSQFTEKEQQALCDWLYTINDIEFPKCNWYFFLLIVNAGLEVNHRRSNRQRMQEAYDWIESAYLGNGWYEDGCQGQRDYYVAFAFHFYSLLLDRYYPACRLKDVHQRAQMFSQDYIYYMDVQGRTLPFGRSLTYRFAHSCFWSACAVDELTCIPYGQIKDILLKNINYWRKQDICQDGIFSIGYAYPNQYLSEDYNAYGSPMWAMKTMIVLSLSASHPFWLAKQQPAQKTERIHKVKEAGMLIVTGDLQTYALSGLQYSGHHISQYLSKYGKFCYSTAFGWNLSRDGTGIENTAADNALMLSVQGTNQFCSRGDIQQCSVHNAYVYSRWKYGNIAEVESFLIPIDEQSHVRIHLIKTRLPLVTYEGGFPVFDWNYKLQEPEIFQNRIRLFHKSQCSEIVDLFGNRIPKTIRQNPNTNIYDPEPNAVPSLYAEIPSSKAAVCFGCIVSGNPAGSTLGKQPKVCMKGKQIIIDQKEILLEEL